MKKSLGASTLALPAPVWVLGTYDSRNEPNIMTTAWCGICCSKPPCVYVSLRKATYSYQNIITKKAFTINIPSETHIREADLVGILSGRDYKKFSKLHLTPIKSEFVDAPYVKEFPLILECELIDIVEIGLHTQFIGKIVNIKADDHILDRDGFPDIEKIKPILFSPGNNKYHGVGNYLGQAFRIGKKLLKKI